MARSDLTSSRGGGLNNRPHVRHKGHRVGISCKMSLITNVSPLGEIVPTSYYRFGPVSIIAASLMFVDLNNWAANCKLGGR